MQRVISSDEPLASFEIVPWSRGFETGIEVIDQQHRQLVRLLNDLAHQYVYGLEPAQLEKIVDGLVDYTAYHFATEEALWVEAFDGDQWLVSHHRSHDGFVAKVRQMQVTVSNRPTESGVDDLLSFLVGWLAHHILYDDRQMAVALLEVRKGQPLPEAKAQSRERLGGQVSALIQSVLNMYKQLTSRTLALQREAYARELAEKKLKEQEEHWKSVLAASNDSLWDWSLDKPAAAHDPDAAASLFARAGQTIHPDDWPGLKARFLDHLLGKTEVFSHQHRVLDRNGKERWIQSRGKVIEHDADGQPSRIVGTQTDITERKTQELILQRERDTRLLISDFAAEFMAASPEEFDAAIERALQRAGEYMGADRTYVFLISEDGRYMSNTHEWCAAGIEPEIENLQNIPVNQTPWWWQQLRTTGYLLIPRVSEMPPEARAEQAILQAQAIRSVCVYPLRMKGELVGFLGNDAVREERHWGPEILQFLQLMGDLLSIALEHRQVQKQREQAANRLARAEQQAHLGHWSYKLDSEEMFWSPEVFRIFELEPTSPPLTYDAYFNMIHPEDRQRTHTAFQAAKRDGGYLHLEHRVSLPSGRVKYLELRGQFIAGPDDKPALIEGTVQDVTEKALHREQLRRLAYEDALTGLPNRRALEDRLQREIEQCEQSGRQLVLALLDLDDFLLLNERHGTAFGDDLLVALGRRIRSSCGRSVFVARIGGDEFVILIPKIRSEEEAFPSLRRLLLAINAPLTVSGIDVKLTASMGVTRYPQPGNVSEDQLLRQAQQALFQAKMQGKNRLQQYDLQWEQNARALTGKQEEIKQALRNREFVLFYQPKVNMATGTVLGAEALIRWQKPSGERLLPGAFLPAIEDHPLEIELGDWVIRTALAQAELWHGQGLDLEVSVNVTSLQILEEAFVSKLEAALAAHPAVAHNALQIEILESSALRDLDKVSQVMQACRELGVRFALDDFGTGFSSLAYLQNLPANVLKIDQSFVRNMQDDSGGLSIISGIIGMSQAFRLQVIAEGVETEAQGDLLLRMGCELGQGYAIARPMPAGEVAHWASRWRAFASWRGQKPVEFHNLPLLHAEVEHRHWVNQLQQWLQGESATLPALQTTGCGLGHWIENDGQHRFAHHPTFTQLLSDHAQLHRVGEQAIDAHARGDEEAVQTHLAQLQRYGKRVLSALRALQRM
jgi:diguanylate cyclase (GGDEF)-like protein/hemerythrin-like metal-binding protein